MVILAGVAAFFLVPGLGGGPSAGTTPVAKQGEPLKVTIAAALSVEPWVSEAAKQFNAEGHTLEGRPIQVTVIAMDGLTAMGY